MNSQTIEEGRGLAILSYFTFIGLIIAIIMNLNKKNEFTFFHIRQMLGLILMLIISNTVEAYVHSWLGTILWGITFLCWLHGLINAITRKPTPIPFLGDKFQNWFQNIK